MSPFAAIRLMTIFLNGVLVLKGMARFGGKPMRTTMSASSLSRSRTRFSAACAASGSLMSRSRNGVCWHNTPVFVAPGHVVAHEAISSALASSCCQPFGVGTLPFNGSAE